MAKTPARPKYVANRTFMVGRFTFNAGDPVEGGRPLELGLKFGFVDSTARRDADPETPPPSPATAAPQENQS